jgi:hypothetical protein
MTYPLVYRWRLRDWFGGKDSPLYGLRCRLLARGNLNSRLVEFENGVKHIISGNALRNAEGVRYAKPGVEKWGERRWQGF